MGASIFAALLRQRPEAGIVINLAPADAGNFRTTAAEKAKQPNDAAKIVIAAGAPDRNKLGVGQHAIARLCLGRLAGADNRIVRGPPLLHRPLAERANCAAAGGGGMGAVIASDRAQACGNI